MGDLKTNYTLAAKRVINRIKQAELQKDNFELKKEEIMDEIRKFDDAILGQMQSLESLNAELENLKIAAKNEGQVLKI